MPQTAASGRSSRTAVTKATKQRTVTSAPGNRRNKVRANSELAPAFGHFRAVNVGARPGKKAKRSTAVLNAADITARLSHSLYTARNEAGMSQERLADEVDGVRPDQIGRWENGRVRISERKLLLLVDYFPYDLGWWYSDHRNGNG